jgi:flagellar biosynthetic protein FliQ
MMTGDLILFIGRRALETALLLAAPILIVSLVVGIVVSLFQAVTSMRDMSLGIVAKLAAVGVTALVAGAWMLQVALSFTKEIFDVIAQMTQG